MTALLEQLTGKFGKSIAPEANQTSEEVYEVKAGDIHAVCSFLKDEVQPSFDVLMDLTAVDYLNLDAKARFATVYQLYSTESKQRLRLKAFIPITNPIIQTVSDLWAGANWYEREVWDMFGIKFKGHPDLSRILMYDEFKGHPLRKDYRHDKRQPLVRNDKPYVDEEIEAYRARITKEKEAVDGGDVPSLTPAEASTLKTDARGEKSQRSFLMNMGPSHPAMHGVIAMVVELDGETVEDVECGIGYLHRAFEKESERGTWHHVFPYTDRLNYVSPLINNVAYAMAVEKLLDVEITERAAYIRVIISEISRITDHLTCVAASTMELGAMTVFLYLIQAREALWNLVEELTGARMTVSYVRVGGLKADLTADFAKNCRAALVEVRKQVAETHSLLTRNRIFVDRITGVGTISKADALSYGFTGPVLRSTGVDFDVRKANPYLVYDQLEFDVPYGQNGDNFDRYLCRMEEIEQSCRIIEQALDKLPSGPLNVDFQGEVIPGEVMADRGKFGQTGGLLQIQPLTDPTLSGYNSHVQENIYPDQQKSIVLPPKEKTYGSIEGVMNHFMLIMDGYGIKPPPGETYQAVEAANGELGFFVVSSGEDHAYRVRVRPPCFALMAGLHKMLIGDQLADIVATFGTINMIAGELDR